MPAKLNELLGANFTFDNIFHQKDMYMVMQVFAFCFMLLFVVISIIFMLINNYRLKHRDRYDSVGTLFKYESKMHISWFLTIFFFMLSVFFDFINN